MSFLDRWIKLRNEMLVLVVLVFFFGFLANEVWRPIGWLTLPVFLFGGPYVFYDAFLRKDF